MLRVNLGTRLVSSKANIKCAVEREHEEFEATFPEPFKSAGAKMNFLDERLQYVRRRKKGQSAFEEVEAC
jgi:hypothetical protein